MYCYNCGKEISDSSKFCSHCGAQQNNPIQQNRKQNHYGEKSASHSFRKIILILIVIFLVFFGVQTLFQDSGKEERTQSIPEPKPAPTEARTPSVQKPTSAPTEEAAAPQNGWQKFNGDRYYFEDGSTYVGLHDIDGDLYYFDDNGALVTNCEVPYGSVVLDIGYAGQVEAVTYEAVYGTWAEESYRFGNGGSSSILELSSEVENCDFCEFYLESSGNRGAKVNGNWKVYIRCHGKWEYVDTINYSEPSGTFSLRFSSPKTFDAITAHPTVQGNASYSSLFYLKNVHCRF